MIAPDGIYGQIYDVCFNTITTPPPPLTPCRPDEMGSRHAQWQDEWKRLRDIIGKINISRRNAWVHVDQFNCYASLMEDAKVTLEISTDSEGKKSA
jgi:hypothetical protein